MAGTRPHTFIEIFSPGAQEDDSFHIDKIVIPRIQRDYAQGRETDNVNRIRTRFVNALYEALVKDDPITLDFVYGEIKDGNLIPLDGQQRLTTLFLLHWYVSKHETVDSRKCDFLKCFSYDTRSGPREFCRRLSEYFPDFSKDSLTPDIKDQSWFPLDWANDPTIASMLVMIDTLHNMFKDTSGIWEKLENGAICFYFLPLKDMGLTDELYIKMNSRGKPLTTFEHFKAELESAILCVDKELSARISRKIDLEWTDMLWPYKGNNLVIDDGFIRYFHFICDIINYRNGTPLVSDPFDQVRVLFSTECEDAISNIKYVETLFNCWCNCHISEFFDKYLTVGKHENDKSIVEKTTNLFKDCCDNYGEMQGERIRKFPIGRAVLLYAFIQYRLHKDEIPEPDFIWRIRVVNNLVRASEFELRDDRMHSLLFQTEEIIIHGIINHNEKSFNVNQILEEIAKRNHLSKHPDEEAQFRTAEDDPLLNGAIRVLGVDNIAYYPRFKSLFKCNRDLVDRALLSTGDYSRLIRRRYQIGSSKIDSVWRDMFNTSKEDMVNTRKCLNALLSKSETFTEEFLKSIVEEFLSSSPALDWRYYIVKYDSMRPGRYGMYRWIGGNEKDSRVILMMTTEKSTSGWNYNIFLKTIFDLLRETYKDLHLGTYAYQHDGDKLIVGSGKAMSCDDSSFTVYEIRPDGSYNPIETVEIKQDESGKTDAEDRVELGIDLVKRIYS